MMGDAAPGSDAREIEAVVAELSTNDIARLPPSELELARALLELDELPVALVVFCARAFARAGLLERAATALSSTADPDALVFAADIADRRGDRAEAIHKTSEALAKRVDTLGAVERLAEWRKATFARTPRVTISIVVDRQPWRVCFQERAILGRTDADIVVPSPFVSRRQLEIFLIGDRPHVVDANSKHGTRCNGDRLREPRPVTSPLTILVADRVSCLIRPARAREAEGVVVVAPTGHHLLAFGPHARLGDWILVRRHGLLTVGNASSAISHRGDTARASELVASPGATFVSDTSTLVVEPESFHEHDGP
jgi:hypothetical protein